MLRDDVLSVVLVIFFCLVLVGGGVATFLGPVLATGDWRCMFVQCRLIEER